MRINVLTTVNDKNKSSYVLENIFLKRTRLSRGAVASFLNELSDYKIIESHSYTIEYDDTDETIDNLNVNEYDIRAWLKDNKGPVDLKFVGLLVIEGTLKGIVVETDKLISTGIGEDRSSHISIIYLDGTSYNNPIYRCANYGETKSKEEVKAYKLERK